VAGGRGARGLPLASSTARPAPARRIESTRGNRGSRRRTRRSSRRPARNVSLNAREAPADIEAVDRHSHHSPAGQDRFGLDSALLAGYVACFGIEAALLPVGEKVAWAEIGSALGLQVGVGLLLGLGPRLRLSTPRFVSLLGITAYLASVALLRDGAPPTAGYGPLVLLPMVWASLRGGRVEVVASLVGLAAVYLVPQIVIGPPQYPVGGWRALLLFVVVASVSGLAVRRLVGRVEQLLKRLGDQARTDALTGLPNRRAWQELLQRECSITARTGHPLTVALLDLDNFKPYNDRHGHLAGDRLLLSVTAAWRSALRQAGVLARWGGDEFLLLLPNCDVRQTEALLERMREAFPGAPFSAGVAETRGDEPPETLLALADKALYRAKRDRRDGIWPPEPPRRLGRATA
jgi:diguanylate cyclase (GGDEF)-like protein